MSYLRLFLLSVIAFLCVIWIQPQLPAVAQVGGIQDLPFEVSEVPRQSATSYGDPHIITFDGLNYSFQTVGEFKLVQGDSGDFEVQSRQKAVPNSSVSLNTAVAMKVGNRRVVFYAQDYPDSETTVPLRIDGKAIPLANNATFQLENGIVHKTTPNDYEVTWKSGEQVKVRISRLQGFDFINVTPALPSVKEGKVKGLLGNYNGNPDDDLQARNGQTLPAESTYRGVTEAVGNFLPIPVPLNQVQSLFFEKLHQDFGDSWRISTEESLFDYPEGLSAQNFRGERGFPREFLTLASFAPAQVQEATAVCQEAGVEGDFLDGCIFDVAATGERGFANATMQVLTNFVEERVLDRVEEEIRDRLPIPNIFRF